MQPYKRTLYLCFILLQFPLLSVAQEFTQNFKALNSFYLELGGNGDAYSVNFDHIIYQRYKLKTVLRGGIGTNLFFMESENNVYPVIPVEATGMIGRKRKHFEFGLGYTRRFTDDPDLIRNMFFGRLGFRYQAPRGGLLVRVALTPFISPETNLKTPGVAVVPRFAFSIGRSFY